MVKERKRDGTPRRLANVVVGIGKPGEKVDGDGAAAPAPKGERSAVSGARETPAKPTPSAAPTPAPAPQPVAAVAPADATRVKASPLARRIAKDAGVDLKLVQGSGPRGRAITRDVAGGPAATLAAQAGPR